MPGVDDVWHVLVTGPVAGLDEWVRAAGDAGWRATPHPLVNVEPTGEPLLSSGDPTPTWIALTSSSAVAPLAAALVGRADLADVRLCCVGDSTAKYAVEAGLPQPVVPVPGAQDARGLAQTLIEHAKPDDRILWPRGDRTREFGELLEAAGLEVAAPIVYRTVAREPAPLPSSYDAVFFASPSAVSAWCAHEPSGAPAAIAIGWTTLESIEPHSHLFSMALPLAAPSTSSFQDCLRSFFPSE